MQPPLMSNGLTTTTMQRYTTVILLCTLLTACAAPQPALKVYSGPDLPLAAVASIRGSNICESDGTVVGETRVISVNGAEALSFDKGYQRDLLVAPGVVKLKIHWFYANVRSKEPASLDVNAEAGHRYIIRAQTDYKKSVHFAIEDKGPHSGSTEFVHPLRADGKPSNCY